MTIAGAIATMGGIGYLRPGPGTWGSFASLPLAWALHTVGGAWLLILATFAAAIGGYFAIRAELVAGGDPDPSEIVIDELVGQWVALWPVAIGATLAGVSLLALWPGLVAGFLAFRLFDIWKPGPVGWAEQLEGAGGVLLDDVVAGWLAALVVATLGVLWHAVML